MSFNITRIRVPDDRQVVVKLGTVPKGKYFIRSRKYVAVGETIYIKDASQHGAKWERVIVEGFSHPDAWQMVVARF